MKQRIRNPSTSLRQVGWRSGLLLSMLFTPCLVRAELQDINLSTCEKRDSTFELTAGQAIPANTDIEVAGATGNVFWTFTNTSGTTACSGGPTVFTCAGSTVTVPVPDVPVPATTKITITGNAGSPGQQGAFILTVADAVDTSKTCTGRYLLRVVDSQAPGVPPALTAELSASGTASPFGMNLGWGAATDDVGVVEYEVQRCESAAGAAPCTNFRERTRIGETRFLDQDILGNTDYSYRVRARDAAGNRGNFSNVATGRGPFVDTEPPRAPSGLTGRVITSPRLDGLPFHMSLRWGAATDNVGVVRYLVEGCDDGGNFKTCKDFHLIGVATGTTFLDRFLSPNTRYRYRVRAFDGAGNASAFSDIATIQTPQECRVHRGSPHCF